MCCEFQFKIWGLRRGPERGPERNFEPKIRLVFRAKCLILGGSPGRIRTSDQPVNSRLLYR
jgi:hypothetical protein